MASKYFKIAYSDIQKKMFPDASSDAFRVGDGAGFQMSISDCDNIINMMEDRLFSLLRATKYFIMLNKIDGEILTYYSEENQTSYQTSLFPISNLKLYSVPNLSSQGWTARNSEYLLANYNVDTITGQITLTTALPKGYRLIADYKHHYSDFPNLKAIIESWTAAEIGRRYLFMLNPNDVERYNQWDAQATAQALSIKSGQNGIPVFDNIEMATNDTNRNPYEIFLRL